MNIVKTENLKTDVLVKFSYPGKWDREYGMKMFLKQTPGEKGIWGNVKFEINNHKIRECDYWFVYENIDGYLFEKGICPRKNCYLITGEEASMWDYPQNYLNQFPGVITSRQDIEHAHSKFLHYISPWHVRKNYDELLSAEPEKTKKLSAIISNAAHLPIHKKRYALINKLKGHFKSKLDWYGKGEVELFDKWEGLAPYCFSIAIENSAYQHYFTEKIIDCFLASTIPFYWGCKNIEEYFPPESFIPIDIFDFEKSINIIEESLNNPEEFKKRYNFLKEAKNLCLNKYQLFPALSSFILSENAESEQREKIIIEDKEHYLKKKFTFKQRMFFHKEKIKAFLHGYN